MEKCKKLNSDFFLPEFIIEHIQYFMSAKEAARTSILSKSWYAAWLSRCDLVFDQRHDKWKQLGTYGLWEANGFWESVKKTLHDELNLRVRSLTLWILYVPLPGNVYSALFNELIVRAMKEGAGEINLGFAHDRGFRLPQEVFESETLIRLSVFGCYVDVKVDQKSRLRSLSLHHVDTKNVDNIISSCPLLENLSLSQCYTGARKSRPFSGLINLKRFYMLKCLFLEKVYIDASFFQDFSSKFPCLKDLSIHCCDPCEEKGIRIACSSLEYISFVRNSTLRAKFDVPCIRKFVYEGSLPSLSFETYSGRWKLDMSLTVNRHSASASWFVRLKRLLAKLSRYEISLSLKISKHLVKSFNNARDVQGSSANVVEDLILWLQVPSSVSSSFLDGLFWSCRPKFITLHLYPLGKSNHDFLELLCKKLKLIDELRENCCIPNQSNVGSNVGLHDLEEVNFKVFDESLAAWQPIPLKTLLDASMSSEYEGKIRLELRWGGEPT